MLGVLISLLNTRMKEKLSRGNYLQKMAEGGCDRLPTQSCANCMKCGEKKKSGHDGIRIPYCTGQSTIVARIYRPKKKNLS